VAAINVTRGALQSFYGAPLSNSINIEEHFAIEISLSTHAVNMKT